jgi:ACS family glucarate transporter-like MFS transporter
MTPTAPRRANWGIVLLLAATATAAYLCRVNISVAGALVMQEYGQTQAQMGRVFSAFLLGYTLFMVPGGLLADSWGARRALSILAWGWVAVTVLQAAIPAAPSAGSVVGVMGALTLLRFLMGVLASPTYPASVQGVSRWITPSAQGRANGLVIGSVGLGSALAPPFVTAVMVPWGWRAAMIASAMPALLLAIAWILVREPAAVEEVPSRSAASLVEPRESHGRVIRRLVRAPGFMLLTFSYTLQGYVGYIFIFWFYLYLVQVRHFTLMQGALAGSLPWVLSAVSIPLGGLLSDRLVGGRLGPVWGRRLVPIAGMGGAGVFISLGAHTTHAWLAAVALAVATALVLCVESPFWTTVAGIAGDRSGTGGAVMYTGCNIGGFISPMLTPVLGEMFGWEPALHVAAGLSVLAALAWFWITPAPGGKPSGRGVTAPGARA